MTLERKPDELWTEYLVRRLQAEGLTDQNFEQTRDKTVDARTGKLELQLSIYTPESTLYIKRGHRSLEESLRRCSTYSHLRARVLELEEEVHVIECGKLRGDLSLRFQEKGSVTVQCPLPISRWPLIDYFYSRATVKPRRVIDNLISYLKEVGVESPMEVGRTCREIQPAGSVEWPDKSWFARHYKNVDIGPVD